MGHSAKRGRFLNAILFALSGVLLAVPALEAQVTVKGDARYRFEYFMEGKNTDTLQGADTTTTRYRNRIRARVGVEAKISDDLKAYVGLATGGIDPVSTNQTFDDAFSTKAIGLDLAYFEWKPSFVPGLNLSGGKVKKPWVMVGDLVWDGDLNPEGMFLSYTPTFGALSPFLSGTYFWVDETSGDNEDVFLYTGQLGTRVALDKAVGFMLGGSYITYTNIQGHKWLYDDKGFGNTEGEDMVIDTLTGDTSYVKNKTFAYGYDVLDIIGEFGVRIGTFPVSLYGNYVMNTAADENNTGMMFGLRLGKASDPGSFEFEANYRMLEKDAVIGAFTDSDFRGGGTDGSGFKFSAKYQFKNFQPALTVFYNTKGLGDGVGDQLPYTRIQADVNFKF